jgi:hypothetical protein
LRASRRKNDQDRGGRWPAGSHALHLAWAIPGAACVSILSPAAMMSARHRKPSAPGDQGRSGRRYSLRPRRRHWNAEKHAVVSVGIVQPIYILREIPFCGIRLDLHKRRLARGRQHKLDVDCFLRLSSLSHTAPAAVRGTMSTSSSKSCHVRSCIRERSFSPSDSRRAPHPRLAAAPVRSVSVSGIRTP